MAVLEHYHNEKQRYIDNCIQCGLCARECPILPLTDLGEASSQEIQESVYEFMDNGTLDQKAYTKAFACMECFKCTADVCPQDLNPMLVNEIIKGEYIARGLATEAYSDPGSADSSHRVLASIQTTRDEYTRITTTSSQKRSRYVFFPGCNVYFQPEKLLNAMDLMDAVGNDWAFLTGLDNCCGDCHFFTGAVEDGAKTAEKLVASIADFQPEAVIFWCPTCHCRLEKGVAPALDIPFNIMSFPQYLAANMDKLPLTEAAAGTVTLHEACKSAYTGVDTDGPRDVLRRAPGVTLIEMEHHGRDTMCCGSGAIAWFPESCSRVFQDRLKEAGQTGADRLITVCHYCNQVFLAEEESYDFEVDSYVNLVAEAIGLKREDKFKKYKHWGNIDRILDDVGEHINSLPFEKKRIVEVLNAFFTDEN